MVAIMMDVDHTSTAALTSATTSDPHLTNAARALHHLAALWIRRHHGHDCLPLRDGEDRLGILEITGSLNHSVH